MVVEVKFLLLDASYEIRGAEPVIMLWGVDERGEPVILLDKSFRPYFYAILDEDADESQVAARVKALSKPRSPIISVERVSRRLYGRPVKTLKITTVIPEYVREYREEVRGIPGVREVLEADIRFALRYLIDKGLRPFSWYAGSAEEIEPRGFRVSKAYMLKGALSEVHGETLPNLKVLAFDIEVYTTAGSPRADRDPIIIIATRNSDGEVRLFVARDLRSDREVIESFVRYILEYDPDIIVGYNSNNFDWPFLIDRSKVVRISLDVGRRVGSPPTTSVYGHVSVPGRLNVDLYNFAEEIPEVKMKTLEEVADYLGVMPKDKRVLIEWYKISEYWDDPQRRRELLKYAEDDVVSTYGLAEKFLPFGIQLSNVTGLPLDQVMAASVGFRLEWYLMRVAHREGELVPNRVERPPETYKGAIVLEPLKGVHENIAVLDFSAMYPNIMIRYNVGPDTLVRPGEDYDPDEVNVAPEVGHKFYKRPPGFFKRVLENLLRLRKEIRSKMRELDPSSYEYRILDERQKVLKVLANASYGYMGWSGARWYCRECAEAVTAWGRAAIKTAVNMARKLGLKVIYGDTDSLFVTYDETKVREFIEMVESQLGFEIKLDKVYRRVFFTEAKKRYVGLLMDGRVDVVGFEAVRGDWTDLAREVQLKVAEIVLREGRTEPAVRYVRNVISDLKNARVSIDKLVIWKTISKRLDEYEVDAPHVRVAREMVKMGFKVSTGDKVGYVIVKGGGKVADRAVPHFVARPEDLDTDYYINHQVIPAALRILSYFGITDAQLRAAGRGQKSLFEFLTGR